MRRQRTITSSYLRACLGRNLTRAQVICHQPDRLHVICECPKCSLKFASLSAVSVHVQKCSPSFTCAICDASYARKNLLRAHLLKEHIHSPPISCQICSSSFKNKSTLEAHVRTHDPRKLFLCIHCGKSFSQSAGLCIHKRNVHQNSSYPCRFCDRVFSKPAARYTHEYAHRYPDSVTCRVCGRTFSQRSALNTHSKNSHPELFEQGQIKKFECLTCGKVYHMKKYLAEHVVVHTKSKNYNCQFCGKLFGWKRSLRHHIYTLHAGEGAQPTAEVQ